MKVLASLALLASVSAEINAAEALNGVDIASMSQLFDQINNMDVAFNSNFVDMMEAPPAFLESEKNARKCAAIRSADDCTGSCSWCSVLKGGAEPSGCRDKLASRRLQATGHYFCAIEGDFAQDLCNGSNQKVCNLTYACNWCEHQSFGKACFTKEQVKLMPFRDVACFAREVPDNF
eukprot:GDKJ01029096.1.p1 GENE.GDKJ01029096.1~~GDKJ01029096.1.p1  ORF type:complete len:177 (+),score=46.18 GDKJ01029096.1:10-540(+)